MIIDTSTIPAILFHEVDAERYENSIAATWPRRMSSVALLEAAMFVESRGGDLGRRVPPVPYPRSAGFRPASDRAAVNEFAGKPAVVPEIQCVGTLGVPPMTDLRPSNPSVGAKNLPTKHST